MIVNSKTIPIEVNNDGKYSISISKSEVKNNANQVVIAASDSYGNIVEKDITELILNRLQGNNFPNNIFQSIGSISTGLSQKDTLNLVFAFFIFVLLGVEIKYYYQTRRLHEKASTLFTLGLFGIVIFSSIIYGFSGKLV